MNKSDQVDFWRSDFGDAYLSRNAPSIEMIRSRTNMWSRILAPIAQRPPVSILEVGANVGNNLRALRNLTAATLHALEPFDTARAQLLHDGIVPAERIVQGAAESIAAPDGAYDLVFTSGVLIHIAPANLPAACREIYRTARRYVVCVEYFSQKPEEIAYHGNQGYLFKRDFGGFYLDAFPDLRLVDYGFFWKRVTGLDDLTWWLFEKP